MHHINYCNSVICYFNDCNERIRITASNGSSSLQMLVEKPCIDLMPIIENLGQNFQFPRPLWNLIEEYYGPQKFLPLMTLKNLWYGQRLQLSERISHVKVMVFLPKGRNNNGPLQLNFSRDYPKDHWVIPLSINDNSSLRYHLVPGKEHTKLEVEIDKVYHFLFNTAMLTVHWHQEDLSADKVQLYNGRLAAFRERFYPVPTDYCKMVTDFFTWIPKAIFGTKNDTQASQGKLKGAAVKKDIDKLK